MLRDQARPDVFLYANRCPWSARATSKLSYVSWTEEQKSSLEAGRSWRIFSEKTAETWVFDGRLGRSWLDGWASTNGSCGKSGAHEDDNGRGALM